MSNQAQCSHSKVARITTDAPQGFTSEHWECPDCKTYFWPESVDMHHLRLRTKFAGLAMQALLSSPRKLNGKDNLDQDDVAKASVAMADVMLHELRK